MTLLKVTDTPSASAPSFPAEPARPETHPDSFGSSPAYTARVKGAGRNCRGQEVEEAQDKWSKKYSFLIPMPTCHVGSPQDGRKSIHSPASAPPDPR